MKLDYLFFSPHPDDAELFCGGTISKITNSKKMAGIIDLSLGEKSSRGNVKERESESKKAASILNIAIRENLKIADTELKNNRENQIKIIRILRKYTPDTVFIPYKKARHPDHKDAYHLINDSIFYAGLLKIDTGQAPFRPINRIYYMNNYEVSPTFIVDISKTFEKKIEAINAYQTQFYNPNLKEFDTYISSKEYLEFIKIKAKFYGFMIGKNYGEPFILEEPFELKDLNLL